MTDDWEKIRNQFRGGFQQEVFTIRHPYSILGFQNCAQDFSAGMPKFKITSTELKEVFHPTLDKIKALIQGQVDAVCNKEYHDPKVS